MNIDDTIFRDTSKMEKVLTLLLWKLHGTNPVELTIEDLKRFDEAFTNRDAQLVVHAHMDGIRVTVMDYESARAFVEQYKAENRGIVTGG